MTLNAYNGKVKELANEIHQSLEKVTANGFHSWKGSKTPRLWFEYHEWEKLNVDKVLKLNVNLTVSSLASLIKPLQL